MCIKPNPSQRTVTTVLRALAIAGVAGSLVLLPAAYAQGDTNAPVQLKPVVVTGSLIPTAETVGSAPVETYTAESIARQGAVNIEQVIKRMPAAIGGGNYGVSRGNGGDGSAGIALRGIPGGTLVLINGRRTAPAAPVAGGGPHVDLNTIPLGMIERMEVLKDGASAIYGADAVAGVVNIITKKDYNGAEVDVQYGNTTSTDASEQRYSFFMGTSDENTSVLIGGAFYKANALYSVDRARSRPDVTDPRNTSGTSNPGRIRSSATDEEDNLVIPAGGLVYGGPPGTTGSSLADYRPFNASTDRFPYPLFTPAIRPSERWNVWGNGERKIFGDHLKFFTESYFSHTYTYNQLAPTPISFIYLTTAAHPDDGMVIPANNPFNVFGVPIDNMAYRTAELGPRFEEIQADSFRFVGGLRGQIGDSTWNWEAAMLYADDSRVQVQGGEVSRLALEQAINDTNPATAFNPFGNRANTAAALDRVGQELMTRGKATLFSLDLSANGQIVDLPGGPLALAVGGGHQEEHTDVIPDSPQRKSDTVGFNSSQPLHGSREVNSAFAELNIPIAGQNFNAPGFYSFEITAAGRYDRYTDFGDTWNPKVSVRWQPIDESLTLRGSYSTSFRPPCFGDLYTLSQESYPELRNPVRAGLSAADPEFDTSAYPIFEQIKTFYEGNPKLKPETSENFTAGAVYTPSFLKDLTASVDWFHISQENIPGTVDQFILDANYAGGGPGNPNAPYANFISYNPQGWTYTALTAATLNLSRRVLEGFDFSLTYALKTESCGTFTSVANVTYVYSFEQEDLPGDGFRDRLGDFIDPSQGFGLGSLPRFKGVFSEIWDFRDFEFVVTGNYIGAYRDDAAAGYDRAIDDYLTFDLQASYKLPHQTKVTVGCLNVIDVEPPLVIAAFADNYDRDTADLRGRFWYVSLNKKF